MEGKEHVLLGDSLSTISCDGKEFSVVNLSVMIEINTIEDCIDLLFSHRSLAEGSLDLSNMQAARVIRIKHTERKEKLAEIEGARVDLIYKISETLHLQSFWRAEVLDSSQDRLFECLERCLVLASVVVSDIT